MRWWSLLILLTGCHLVFELEDDPKDPGDASGGKGFSRTITIDQRSGMTLENFPVSVVLENDAALLAHAAANGSDILFSGLDGTELNAEVFYDGAGTLDAWVQIPSLPSAPSQIQLRYGGASRSVVAAATWSNTYVNVWHFSEVSGNVAVDTVTGANAAAFSPGIPVIDAGRVGRGRVFDGVDDVMCTFDPLFADFDQVDFSIAGWILVQAPGATIKPINKGSGGNIPGYRIELDAARITAVIGDGNVNVPASAPMAPFGSWVQFRASIIRTTAPRELRLHVNGRFEVAADIAAVVGSLQNSTTLCFGGDQAERFIGTLDEVRIYNGTQTNEWIFAEHDNITNRSDFVRIEAEIEL